MLLNEITGSQIKTNYLTPKQANVVAQFCKPYLEMINYDNVQFQLWRGMNIKPGMTKLVDNVYLAKGYRENRKPTDTPQEIHDQLNQLFTEKFSVPFRNGTFCTSDRSEAEQYGTSAVQIFPMFNFKFCWSPHVVDLFSELRYLADDENLETESGKVTVIQELQNIVNGYQTTNLQAAIKSGHEIMLYCDQYIVVDNRGQNAIIRN